jgi:chromosome partitioning protein
MIILVAHEKGGVGKSTLAVNLAAEALARGRNVLIAEADPSVYTARLWARTRQEAGHSLIPAAKLRGNIADTLLEFAKEYDDIVVDVAGKDSKELRTAMAAADVLVAPMQPFQPDLDAAEQFADIISIAKEINPKLAVLAVLNRVPTNAFNSEARQAIEYLEDYPELPLASVRIHERKSYRTSLEQGLGVVETKDGKAKAEIQLLMNEILAAVK